MRTLDDLLKLHEALSEMHIARWIARGLLRPVHAENDDWRFEEVDVARTALLAELVTDFGLDDDTAETVVDLLDQVHTLRRQLYLLGRAIEQQPPEAREAIGEALKRLRDR
jgi:chaperone modulatory protein CbpM